MPRDWDHISKMELSYNEVASVAVRKKSLQDKDIKSSRLLFTDASLKTRKPIPIEVDVYAVLSGIPFNTKVLEQIFLVQQELKESLINTCSYFVELENLGVEYAVLKWPQDMLHQGITEQACKLIANNLPNAFELKVIGIQVHADGCIILKGVDQRCEILHLRQKLVENINLIPRKQSNWTHIPLGRILEPLDFNKFRKLKSVICQLNKKINFSVLIEEIHVVHETRWYMESKEYLKSFRLEK